MKVNIVGVPTNYGCDKNGVQYGPRKIREAMIIDTVKNMGIDVNDLGDIYIENISEEDKFKDDVNIKYYKSIYDSNLSLANTVYNSLSNGCFHLTLGGDHSLALGSISGASKYFHNLAVVWIDAHGDFNTEIVSTSKNAHGMPLAFLCGFGNNKLVNLFSEGKKLKEENVFHIGGRDIDIEEQNLLDSTNVNMYNKEKIDNVGFKNILDEILLKCEKQKVDAIHISLDIDFMDKDIVPGTGTKVGSGYSIEDTKFILKQLIHSGLVKSMDLVEFNPSLDIEDKTLNICDDLIVYLFEQFNL